ncbi:sensor histidine kinase [Nonomuraea mesophila]|uniref:histidine kinase n=1 Tax=Nonomuraea mesophila TaxID=2530382 RepID=A0A4R5EI17_9ACTN|nr:sensor histidine kinase [Nonomuraea mesophila]TDE33994.1 sensor histidine kinase [Nonomuraea mesophila]
MTSLTDRTRSWSVDAWPCLPFLAVNLVGTGPAAVYQPDAARPLDAGAYALVVAAALALAWRRRPGLVLLLNGAAVVTYLAAGYPFGPVLLTVPAAMYGVATAWPTVQAGLVVAADFGVLIVGLFAKIAAEPGASGSAMAVDVLVWGAVTLVVLTIGATLRIRREAAAGVRTEQARRMASEERLRMAQDLHDTIGHGLAAIAMQAGVALHVLDREPVEARQAMEAVRATSREALDSLRAELEHLRGDEPAQRRPVPGLDGLGELAGRVRAAGIDVTLDVQPDLGLAAPVNSAVFRIVRESLTNVLRHAGAAAVRVLIRRDGDELLVEVTDTGGDGASRITSPGGGLGIRGMRAQTEQLGGELEAGPLPGGGFSVTARIPVEEVP